MLLSHMILAMQHFHGRLFDFFSMFVPFQSVACLESANCRSTMILCCGRIGKAKASNDSGNESSLTIFRLPSKTYAFGKRVRTCGNTVYSYVQGGEKFTIFLEPLLESREKKDYARA